MFCGPAHAGELAVPLLNYGLIHRSSFSFAGATFEVNPFDPLLTSLHPLYLLNLDAQGQADGYLLPFHGLPHALGLYIGTEFAIVDPQTFTITGTTQAVWIGIE